MPSSPNALLFRFSSRADRSLAAAQSSLRLAGTGLEFEPLFEVASETSGTGLTGSSQQWFIARPKASTAGANPWDLAHEALGSGLGVASGLLPDFIEPDLEQPWLRESPAHGIGLAATSSDACLFDDQNKNLPFRPAEFAWHLGDAFSQLRRARTDVANSSAIVRIAHLDTGFDPGHSTFPAAQMELSLQRNFVEGENIHDASDPGNTGVLRNPGHGAGTLSILAGGRFQFSQHGYLFDEKMGGAPNARIVPVRVGNSVVQLTTSSIARGIDYVVGLSANSQTRVDVISMSMGGVASAAWADAVNKAYEAGIIYVAAAGNNISAGLFGFPTHQIVYPARFRRVIAACGIMANRQPYYGLKTGTMQGNWGPAGKMATALSAFTPNISWAHWGCQQIVRMDGAGTSAATPQIAAAVALYLQKHAATLFNTTKYSSPWMRVEAVRQALFQTADKSADAGKTEKLGNGILQAAAALAFAPPNSQTLQKTRADSAGFPFLNVLFGTGLTTSTTDRMLQLEATQLIQRWSDSERENPLESVVADPDEEVASVSQDQVRRFLEIVSEHRDASNVLKTRARQTLDGMTPRHPRRPTNGSVPPIVPAPAKHSAFVPPNPPHRKLRGYAVDPSLATKIDTVGISEVTFRLPWEKLKPGPSGEYLEVIDVDPASRFCYEPVDLDAPVLLAQDGLPPSEGVPQFHQQMVYAIASLTINNFEQALGRKSLWRPGPPPEGANEKDDSHYVQQLRIFPHALREANAYYSPQKIALLFGYFNALADDPADHLPGGRVFTCLSHDIVAHETTHALLDGMHRRFLLPSNRDVHAFHEGFADCVAMLQHFTFPELVAHQISATRGDITTQENLLMQLAVQFGRSTGQRMALRDAIGKEVNGEWTLRAPDTKEYETVMKPHDRGRILVAAVFDAFLAIYKRRTSDLLRLATEGSGILRPGAIHPDLVSRLAQQAAKSAQHVLTMCIRALDYCPPTDITFGEYLRAIITADYDLVADDDLNYRVSFIEAFRRRGIFPPGVRTLSVGSLLWRSPDDETPMPSGELLRHLNSLRMMSTDHFYAESRRQIFDRQRETRKKLHYWLEQHFKGHSDGGQDARFLGLDPTRSFEVHTARIAFRAHPDGGVTPQLIVGLLQDMTIPVDPKSPDGPTMSFEGGCTLIADLREGKVQYCIRKNLSSQSRLKNQRQFALSEFDSLHATYLGVRSLDGDSASYGQEPFALLHRGSL